jgi:hypothetical protein
MRHGFGDGCADAAGEPRGMGGDMPESPVSPAREHAIGWHEAMCDLVAAGFTRTEAFDLIARQWDAYFTVLYETKMTRDAE